MVCNIKKVYGYHKEINMEIFDPLKEKNITLQIFKDNKKSADKEIPLIKNRLESLFGKLKEIIR